MTADDFLDELDRAVERTRLAARDSGKAEVALELGKLRYRLAAARERDRVQAGQRARELSPAPRVWVVLEVTVVEGQIFPIVDVAGDSEKAEKLRADAERAGLKSSVFEREVQS